jgi:hypothetical protein
MFFIGLLLGIVFGAWLVNYSLNPTFKMYQKEITELVVRDTQKEILIGRQLARCMEIAKERDAWRDAWKNALNTQSPQPQLPDSLVKLLRSDRPH